MKKNKKFWKAEAKALGERCDELEETLDQYMFQVIILEDEVDQLTDERDRLKNELSVFRQYNIGKPHGTNSITSTAGMDKKGRKTVEDLAKPAEKSIIRWLKFDK
jgi:hypothetical protein